MTGSLQQKNGKYYAVINLTDKNGKRKQKWINTGFEIKGNKKKAEQFLRDKLKEFEANDNPLICDILFAEYVEKWLEKAKIRLDIITYQGYLSIAKSHIIPYFKKKKIKLIELNQEVIFKIMLILNLSVVD